MSSNIIQMRKTVEQLRHEVSVRRVPLSQTLPDLCRFIIQNQSKDVLVTGFKRKDQNPFKEKDFKCDLL